MESTDSSSGSQHQQLPPGFRFHPTDEELVVHYLKKKAASVPLPVTIIAEIDLYKFDPWELPSKATFGEQEWYFFSPRDRKYPNGARPNRAATSGYWKATGTDKPILTSDGTQKVGVKKALVFYGGKPPKGIKTNWIMHEYRLIGNNPNSKSPAADVASKKGSLRLDDWVLCRIYKKKNSQRPMEHEGDDSMENMLASLKHQKPNNHSSQVENNNEHFFDGILTGEESLLPSSLNHNNNTSIMATTTTNSFPVKRSVSSEYWNEGGSSLSKRFHGDHNSGDDNNSFVSLLQLPQNSTSSFQHNSLLGSLNDGVFRQLFQLPTMNWNS